MPVRQSAQTAHRMQVALARRYLRAHLALPLTLSAVARVAAASPYHFSRLYRAFTGETVFRTLTRFRLEAGARRLLAAPEQPITAIALEVGYATPSAFTKAFRAGLGLSPSQYRAAPNRVEPRASAPMKRSAKGRFSLARRPARREAEPLRVAFVREHGEYGEVSPPLAWGRLAQTLGEGGLTGRRLVGAASDDPRVVVAEALRYDAGIVLEPGEPAPEGTTGATWRSGRHLVFEFRGPYRFISVAFDRLFRTWSARGFPRVRAAPCVELYRNSPADTAEHDLVTELWIPVEER